jgi:hypothetical protein
MDDTAPDPKHEVTHVRQEPCPKDATIAHIAAVMLAREHIVQATDLAALIDAGAFYWMTPLPGAPAYEAHLATGLPLIIQTRSCPGCGAHVIFA